MFKNMLTAFALILPLGAAADAKPRGNDMMEMMRQLGGGGLTGDALTKAIANADKSPLGSKDNPVRVNMPPGERAYLNKLRCADGNQPSYDRAGSVGVGPFGNILDDYVVTCKGMAPVEVYMDMYFEENETRTIPGFTSN
jgi:hypothetical protein